MDVGVIARQGARAGAAVFIMIGGISAALDPAIKSRDDKLNGVG